jgi:hypothetical protein
MTSPVTPINSTPQSPLALGARVWLKPASLQHNNGANISNWNDTIGAFSFGTSTVNEFGLGGTLPQWTKMGPYTLHDAAFVSPGGRTAYQGNSPSTRLDSFGQFSVAIVASVKLVSGDPTTRQRAAFSTATPDTNNQRGRGWELVSVPTGTGTYSWQIHLYNSSLGDVGSASMSGYADGDLVMVVASVGASTLDFYTASITGSETPAHVSAASTFSTLGVSGGQTHNTFLGVGDRRTADLGRAFSGEMTDVAIFDKPLAQVDVYSMIQYFRNTFVSALEPAATVDVTLSPSSVLAGAPGGSQGTAVARTASGVVLPNQNINWSSSAPAVATVDTDGHITPVAAGTAVITATDGTASGSATLTVAAANAGVATSIRVTITPSTVLEGQTAQAHADFLDAAGNVVAPHPITWDSSDGGHAGFDVGYIISQAAYPGITLKASGYGLTGSAYLTITRKPVASLLVTWPRDTIEAGEVITPTVVAYDADGAVLTGREYALTSDAASIATPVQPYPSVEALAPGSAHLSVVCEGITSDPFQLFVLPGQVYTIEVVLNPASPVVGSTFAVTTICRNRLGTVMPNQVAALASSNTGVATVPATSGPDGAAAGIAVADGMGAIVATVNGRTGRVLFYVGERPLVGGPPVPVPGETDGFGFPPADDPYWWYDEYQYDVPTPPPGIDHLAPSVTTVPTPATRDLLAPSTSSGPTPTGVGPRARLLVNGADLGTLYGLRLSGWTLPNAGNTIATAARVGGASTVTTMTVAAGTLKVEGTVRGTSGADANLKARQLLKALRIGNRSTMLRIELPEVLPYAYFGFAAANITTAPLGHGLVTPAVKVTIEFLLPDPAGMETGDFSAASPALGTPVAIATGSAPSYPLVAVSGLSGAARAVTVSLRDAQGVVVRRFIWTIPTADVGSLSIGRSEGRSVLTATTASGAPMPNPTQYIDPTSDWPLAAYAGEDAETCTVEVSPSAGTASVTCIPRWY